MLMKTLEKSSNKLHKKIPMIKKISKARKTFSDVNFTTENIYSVTIDIETKMVKYWENVLTENVGAPIDRSKEPGKNNAKQWIDEAFKDEKEDQASKMFVTLWHKGRKERSTLLIQSESSCQFLNVTYVTKVVPKIYNEALDHFEKENPQVSSKKTPKLKTPASPMLKRTSMKVVNSFVCKHCVYSAKNVSQLNDHMIAVHKNKAVPKIKQPSITKSKTTS